MKKIMTLLVAMVGVFGQAYSDDQVTTASTADMLRQGMTWEVSSHPGVVDPDHPIPDPAVFFRIDGYYEWKGKLYSVLRKASIYRNNATYGLRCEDDKIYARFLDREDDDEFLAYDFTLKPGEGTYVTYMFDGRCHTLYQQYYVKCVSIERKIVCNIEYEFMNIECYWDETCKELMSFKPMYWIKGIGSRNGVIEQILFSLGSHYILERVYYSPDIIYDSAVSDQESVRAEDQY